MDNLIRDIEEGKTVTIGDTTFDKGILEELSIDLRGAYHIYKDSECRKFISLYASTHKKHRDDIYSHNILVAFIIGFAGGVIVAGVLAMIEQFIISTR